MKFENDAVNLINSISDVKDLNEIKMSLIQENGTYPYLVILFMMRAGLK